MAGSIGFQKRHECAWCGSTADLAKLAVPYFEQEGRWLCKPCRVRAEADGSELSPFELELPLSSRWRGTAVSVADARFFRQRACANASAAGAEARGAEQCALADRLLEAIAGGAPALALDELERRADRFAGNGDLQALAAACALATAGVAQDDDASHLDAAQRQAVELARRTLLLAVGSPSDGEREIRLGLLRATVDLAQARLDDADRRLAELLRRSAKPAALQARLHLLQARVHARRGHRAGVDRALIAARAALGAMEDPSVAPEVAAEVGYGEFVRALEREQWDRAGAALAAYCEQRPGDREARRSLAILRVKNAERLAGDRPADDALAFAAAWHADAPDDGEAALVHAAALHRTARHAEASSVLTDMLAREPLDPDRAAAGWHLAGLAALATNDRDRALEHLRRAFAARPESRAIAADLWHVVHERLRAVLARPDATAAAVVEQIEPARELLERRHGTVPLCAMLWLLLRELGAEFVSASGPAMTPPELEAAAGSSQAAAVQVVDLLARRDVTRAIAKNRDLEGLGAAPLPIVLLGHLLERARSWSALDREQASWQVRRAFEARCGRLG